MRKYRKRVRLERIRTRRTFPHNIIRCWVLLLLHAFVYIRVIIFHVHVGDVYSIMCASRVELNVYETGHKYTYFITSVFACCCYMDAFVISSSPQFASGEARIRGYSDFFFTFKPPQSRKNTPSSVASQIVVRILYYYYSLYAPLLLYFCHSSHNVTRVK